MEEREEICEPKKKRLGRRKYNDGEQYAPLESSDSREGMALGTDWALV